MADLPESEIGHLSFLQGTPITMESQGSGPVKGYTFERLLGSKAEQDTSEVHG